LFFVDVPNFSWTLQELKDLIKLSLNSYFKRKEPQSFWVQAHVSPLGIFRTSGRNVTGVPVTTKEPTG